MQVRGEKRRFINSEVDARKRAKVPSEEKFIHIFPTEVLATILYILPQEDAYSFSKAYVQIAELVHRFWKPMLFDHAEFRLKVSLLDYNFIPGLENKWDKVDLALKELSRKSAIKQIVFILDRSEYWNVAPSIHSCSILTYRGDFVIIDMSCVGGSQTNCHRGVQKIIRFSQTHGFEVDFGHCTAFLKPFTLLKHRSPALSDQVNPDGQRYQVITVKPQRRKFSCF